METWSFFGASSVEVYCRELWKTTLSMQAWKLAGSEMELSVAGKAIEWLVWSKTGVADKERERGQRAGEPMQGLFSVVGEPVQWGRHRPSVGAFTVFCVTPFPPNAVGFLVVMAGLALAWHSQFAISASLPLLPRQFKNVEPRNAAPSSLTQRTGTVTVGEGRLPRDRLGLFAAAAAASTVDPPCWYIVSPSFRPAFDSPLRTSRSVLIIKRVIIRLLTNC